MRLYGKALANQIPATTTGHQARTMFGAMTEALAHAYDTLGAYDASTPGAAAGALSGIFPFLGAASAALDPGEVAAAQSYLDSTNEMLAKYFPRMPASDDVLTDQQLAELRTSVSTSSAAVQIIDELFGTSWLSQLSDSIVEACGTVTAAIASTVAKVGGSMIGGMWWLLALGLGGLLLWHKYGHKLVT
jgi:hypothetical protein